MFEFQSFAPFRWFTDGLEVVHISKTRHPKPSPRGMPWQMAIAVSAVTAGLTSSAAAFSFDPRQVGAVFTEEIREPLLEPHSSAAPLDRSFSAIFGAVEGTQSLLPSPEMRRLARLAVDAKPDADIHAWAQRLAEDTKKAND